MPEAEDFFVQRPPAAPWRPIPSRPEARSYLSVYLSDDLSRLPVRAVTLLGNNKSDPNFETGTYGLFSTCERGMRSGAVRRGAETIFFLTNHRERGRVITGYFDLGWFTEGSLWPHIRDYALAARKWRFVDPIVIKELSEALQGEVSRPFRLNKLIDHATASELRALINSRADRTPEYVAEVERLERWNSYYSGGYRYVNWQRRQGFTWASASEYLTRPSGTYGGASALNSSPSGWWKCDSCGAANFSGALLKACPTCGALGTLRPISTPDTSD